MSDSDRPFTESTLELQASYLVDLIRAADHMLHHHEDLPPGFTGLVAVICERAEKLHEEIAKAEPDRQTLN